MKEITKKYSGKIKGYKVDNYSYNIKLDANESPFNIVKELKDIIIDKIMVSNLNRYPDNDLLDIKEALANYVGHKSENIICGNGSDQIIKIIIDTFIEKGDRIITHNPTFSMYKIAGEIAGAKVIEVEDDKNFKIQIDSIIYRANECNAKIIFLCNPNNPTGQTIRREDIIKVLQSTKSIVVVDEAYYEFYGESMVGEINNYDRLIVLRTLSKAFGLAGLRVGYGIGNKDIIGILDRVKPPYNLNTISQIVSCEVLKNIDLVKEYIEYMKKERTYFINELEKIETFKVVPSFGNFFLLENLSSIDLAKAFKSKAIGVRGYGEDELLNNHIRISVGTREENNKVLEVLREVMK